MANQRSVFISLFRGEEDTTPKRFTDDLSKALNKRRFLTFIDDQEDEITPTVLKCILESTVAIIVISENYAASSFCLEKLAFILDNFQKNHTGRFIFPVFYNIDHSHVKWLIGPFGQSFSRRWLNESREKVNKWKSALTQVANLSSGCHFSHRDGNEFDFVDKVVEKVSMNFHHAPLHVVDYTVGLDSRLGEVYSLLELESHEALVVGIYGNGGRGKTTLARAVYNMIAGQFEASYFLFPVGQRSRIHGSNMTGLKNIELRDTRHGISLIKDRLQQKKVLLILDDMNSLGQSDVLVGGLDWLGSGSRVIVTTQNTSLLSYCRIERRYEVQKLNRLDALKLLSHKAFNQGSVDPNYTELVDRVVTYALGIPLVLKVIGSMLYGKSVEYWKSALDKFERIPHKDILSILKQTFDALDQVLKNIFLDIACCFDGYELTYVENILSACYGHGIKLKIKVLTEKSLVNISIDGKVTLHSLIVDMGRKIVKLESPYNAGRRRLWSVKDIVEVLTENTGTDTIEIIHLDSPEVQDRVIKWDGEAFKNMKNLKILILKNCYFSKPPKYLPESLKVLEWWAYPSDKLPSNFDSKQLVICKPPRLAELLEISDGVPEVFQISQRAEIHITIPPRDFQAKTTWRLVGLISSVVGLLCYALSPSFNHLIGTRKPFKLILYVVLSLVLITTILFAKKSSFPTRYVNLKTYMSFAVLMIMSVYSFLYDKAVNGKPDILSVVSNAAFALVSLSLHKQVNFGFEIGVFSYFLGCCAVQLLTINWMLIFVAIIIGCPLFVMHSSLNSRSYSEVARGDEQV